jgi:hypothetical protein
MMDVSKALGILGLASNPTQSEIKQAYREQVKLWHPDRYSNGSAMKKMAEKNIQDANLAYAFLKSHMPPTSNNVAPRSTRAICKAPTPLRSLPVNRLIDRGIQLLAILSQRFPRIHFRSVLEWLQNDARNHYRPWYRYPTLSDFDQKGKKNVSFDQALQRAMENRTQIKRIHRMRRSSQHIIKEDTVTPVSRVSKSVKSDRT